VHTTEFEYGRRWQFHGAYLLHYNEKWELILPSSVNQYLKHLSCSQHTLQELERLYYISMKVVYISGSTVTTHKNILPDKIIEQSFVMVRTKDRYST
jgi:hypothetical protein